MSISVDDSGLPDRGDHPIPLTELRALDWLDIWHHHHTKYPDLAAEQDAADVIDALDYYSDSCDVPGAYVRALRAGTPDTRYRITIDGRPVYIVLAAPPGPVDPARESQSWAELCRAVDTAGQTGCDGIHPALPRELALAVWNHNGREITACRPGAPVGAIRRARSRIRRRLAALSPFPLLGVLTQPLSGGATAVGIALAPVMPPVHAPQPPAPVTRDLGGEIARPELPHLPGLYPAATPAPALSPVVPAPPDESAASDTSPRPATPPGSPQDTAPAAPTAPPGSTTVSPTPEPAAPSPTPSATVTVQPTDTPALLDTPEDPPASSPTVQVQPPSAVTRGPRGHAHGHRPGKHPHKPHPSRSRR